MPNKEKTISLSKVIKMNEDKCVNCHSCIRVCPVKYCNKDSGNSIEINHDLCIGCGRCITACTHNAREYVDDFKKFKKAIEEKKPIIAIVAPSVAAFFPNQYLNFNGWLKHNNIDAIFDVSFGAELTVKSYLEYIKKEKPDFLIAQPCPVLVNYIEIYKSHLLENLAPIDSPMSHTIKYIKEFHPEYKDHTIVAITPCIAKKREFDATFPEVLNVLHLSLLKYFDKKNINLENYPPIEFDNPPAEKGVLLSSPRGLSKALMEWEPEIGEKIRQIEGETVFNYFDKIQEVKNTNPESLPLLVDCVNCAFGCNGSFTRTTPIDEIEHIVAERCKQASEYYKQTDTNDLSVCQSLKETINTYWDENLYKRSYINRSKSFEFTDFDEMQKWQIFYQMNKFSPEDLYNCGACGYDECASMALAIHRGLNKSENCHHFLLNEYYRDLEILKIESSELEKLKDDLEERVKERTLELEKQKRELSENQEVTLGLMRDTEEAKKKLEYTNKILEEERIKAQKANKAKSQFLANMSHEIRTPLNGVIGFIQLLSETSLGGEQIEFVTEAKKSSEMLLHVINDILDFSKIEAGKMSIDKSKFNLRYAVEDIATLCSTSANDKNLELNAYIDTQIPEKLIGDASRIKQVLNNLVNNSIKFTNEGEIELLVKYISETKYKVKISFEIKDTGIGISKKDQKKIFESFTQADITTTRTHGGTGLGLSISKKIINLMGGDIELKSQRNKGTTVSFILDLQKSTNEASEKIDLNKLNVLVLDKNETSLKILKEYLSEANCKVEAIKTTDKAFKILDKKDIGVIIIDYKIYMQNNNEFLDKLRANPEIKNTPILLLNSIKDISNVKKEFQKGVLAHINKPIRKHLLIKVIDTIFNHKIEDANQEVINCKLETKNSKAIKVLVAEDNNINMKLLTKILENNDIAFDVASNGKEAVEQFKKEKYDLILMDCQLPILDGYQATKAIRKLEEGKARTPIVALTAYALATDVKKSIRAGMDTHISKPIDKNKLIEIVEKLTSNSSNKSINVSDNNINLKQTYQRIITATGFTEEEIDEIFSEFLDKLPITIEDLYRQIENNDYPNIARIAHTLKGMGANLRLDKLISISVSLEKAAKEKNKEICDVNIQKINYFKSNLKNAYENF